MGATTSRGVAAAIYQPLCQGKRGHRQRLRHSAAISAAESHDNQIIIVQVGQLTGRRDTSHRLLANPLCVSRLQAGKISCRRSPGRARLSDRPQPIFPPLLISLLGDGPGNMSPSPGHAAGPARSLTNSARISWSEVFRIFTVAWIIIFCNSAAVPPVTQIVSAQRARIVS
jgi:hypothetical protein